MRRLWICVLAAGAALPAAGQRKETCPLDPPKTLAPAPLAVDLSGAAGGVQARVDALAKAGLLARDAHGRLAVAEPAESFAPLLAAAILDEVRPRLEAAAPAAGAWDAEMALRIGGETRLLRVVVGRDAVSEGGDGNSPGIVSEDRAGTILIVAGGRGAAGRPGEAGGAGGDALVEFSAEGGIAIALGGSAGLPGAPALLATQSGRARLLAREPSQAGPPTSPPPQDGKPGGNAFI